MRARLRGAWGRWPVAGVALALLTALGAGPALPVGAAPPVAGVPDFTRIVAEVSPAVVNISTRRRAGEAGAGGPHGRGGPFPHDPFRRFFGDPEAFRSESLGSGFIISADGYVLTNHHVVKDAGEITVRLSDRREFIAELVGSDERSDVALLKIEARDLPVVRIGRSSELKVGEWVLAIGSPFDFDHTVTAGIVSALRRSLPNENYVPFIQTDVAINPGNSGGPLFNLRGEVVGINAQIYSRTGGFMGLSFAIPIDLAMNVVRQLKEKGRVSRGWLGILIQDVTRELAESFDMERPEGALVAQVMPDSPAERAGIRVGDVVLTFDGQPVESSAALPPMVGATPVGKEVPVEVLREGRRLTLQVRVGELPEDPSVAAGGPREVEVPRLALVVADLGPEEAEPRGVRVVSVGEGPAREAGLRPGDRITMLDQRPVEGAEQLRRLVEELPAGRAVSVLVERDAGPLFLALRIPAEERR